MTTGNLKHSVLLTGIAFFVFSGTAHANLNMIKAYKEVYPDAHPKCINCHLTEKPSKTEGMHENNAYGKAVKEAVEADAAAAQVVTASKISDDDLKLLSDKFSKIGSYDDFKETAGK